MSIFRPDADRLLEDHPELFDTAPRRRGRRKAGARADSDTSGSGTVHLVAWLGILVICIPLALVGASVGALAGWLESCPMIPEMDSYDPPEATTIYDRNGKPVASLFEQQRFVVPLDDMTPELILAFVSIEDQRFYRHFGVDPFSIARAAAFNVVRGRTTQGASTITQQTARNLLPRVGRERTAERKVREMLIALQMEHRYTKEQILEVYLNQIYLGSGTWGVEAAARTYFGKSVSELSLEECAVLAGLPQLPERFSPLNNPDLALRRRNIVLSRMLEIGYIDGPEFDRAILSELEVSSSRVSRTRAPYFIDAVRREIANSPNLGTTSLHAAGWSITTTMEPALQELAENVVLRGLEREEEAWLTGRRERFNELRNSPDYHLPPAPRQVRMAEVIAVFNSSLVIGLPGGWRADVPIPEGGATYFAAGDTIAPGDGVDIEVLEVQPGRGGLFRARLLPQRRLQGALVSLDVYTGDVLALVGGRDFNDRANNGFFNRAVQAYRQGGSTLKPFFFAAGLENGMTPYSVVRDEPVVFRDGYAPRNYENRFFGPTTLQTALEHSRNIPTIRITQEVGLRESINFVAQFQRTGSRRWDLPMEWPVVLGTTPMTPLELAAAYQPIANGGLARGPQLVKSAWNEKGREAIGLPQRTEERLISPRASAHLVQMMTGVMTHGTGEKLRDQLPLSLQGRVAGKSGTTNDNRDAWFAGFTPHEVVVVWVGFDSDMALAPGRTGSRAAGPIWADFVAHAWNMKSPEEQQTELVLPAGYKLVAVNPANGDIIESGARSPRETPVFRVMTTEEIAQRRRPSAEVSAHTVLHPGDSR